jgi:hypothetical protein
MACEILNGILGVCDYSASGVQALWLANKANITGVTYNVSGEVTGITWLSGTTLVYAVDAALDSITFEDSLVINGTRRNFLETINFGLNSIDATIIGTLEDIGLSNLVAFLEVADGSFRGFGLKGTGLRATVMVSTSGTASANDSKLEITIAGSNRGKAPIISTVFAQTFLK